MLAGLVALLAAQLFDVATFVQMIRRHGADAEVNPIVASILADHGVATLVVVKLAAVALVSAVVAVLVSGAPGRRLGSFATKLAALIVVIGIAAGLVGGLSNGAGLV
jgi:hypothetical protein